VRSILLCTAAALCLVSCTKSPNAPSSSAPYSQQDLLLGTGDEAAAAGRVLTVNYTGWIYDPSKPDNKGLQFDTSVGHDPFVFTLGIASVIAGWDKGIAGMKVGGVRRLVIPPSLAYGDVRNNSIPAYATLVFDVELIGIAPTATAGGS
jgi:FKBP-type peptidyl-prolyl cis-trans isomerase